MYVGQYYQKNIYTAYVASERSVYVSVVHIMSINITNPHIYSSYTPRHSKHESVVLTYEDAFYLFISKTRRRRCAKTSFTTTKKSLRRTFLFYQGSIFVLNLHKTKTCYLLGHLVITFYETPTSWYEQGFNRRFVFTCITFTAYNLSISLK